MPQDFIVHITASTTHGYAANSDHNRIEEVDMVGEIPI
jgi:hypothetical protein